MSDLVERRLPDPIWTNVMGWATRANPPNVPLVRVAIIMKRLYCFRLVSRRWRLLATQDRLWKVAFDRLVGSPKHHTLLPFSGDYFRQLVHEGVHAAQLKLLRRARENVKEIMIDQKAVRTALNHIEELETTARTARARIESKKRKREEHARDALSLEETRKRYEP